MLVLPLTVLGGAIMTRIGRDRPRARAVALPRDRVRPADAQAAHCPALTSKKPWVAHSWALWRFRCDWFARWRRCRNETKPNRARQTVNDVPMFSQLAVRNAEEVSGGKTQFVS